MEFVCWLFGRKDQEGMPLWAVIVSEGLALAYTFIFIIFVLN